jgi:hypothetical protein
MDAERFDQTIRGLFAAASRRGLIAAVMSGLVAITPRSWDEWGTEAKKGRRRRRRRRQRKQACRGGQKVFDICCPRGANNTLNDVCVRHCDSFDHSDCVPGSQCHQGIIRAPGPNPCGTADNPYCFCGEYVNQSCIEQSQPECVGHEQCGPGQFCDFDGCCYTPTYS